MKHLFTRLKQHEKEFTHSQSIIAAYIREHSESIAFSTLEELAAAIGTSTTTVIRFARSIGYDGFADLQNSVKNAIQKKATLPDRLDSLSDGSGNSLLNESFALDQDNIQETLAAQNNDDLTKAVDLIQQANKIFILGMRSSFSIAYYLAARLGEIKPNIRFIQSTGMLYPEEIASAEEGDVCVAYFFPRYSKTASDILLWMKKRGVKCILFTGLEQASITEFGDIYLPCALKSTSYKNSLTAPICLTNYLITELAKRDLSGSKEMLSRIEDVLSFGSYLGL